MNHLRLAILSTLLISFPLVVLSQEDCEAYFPMDDGSTFEITNYNAKGKVTGKAEHAVYERIETADGVEAIVHSRLFDEKGKEITQMDYKVRCKPGMYEFEMGNFTNSQMQGMDLEANVAGDFLEIPADPLVGQKLQDGKMTVEMNEMMSMTTTVTGRVVEAKETVETPAGTFDCIVISSTSETKMMMTVRVSSKEWFAKGVGMVKSESYDKKGKLQGYSLLTKLNK